MKQLWRQDSRPMGEWVIITLRQLIHFSAISWREQVNLQWNDDKVRFVLDQHT
jgi:hypothetical protein